MNYYEILGLDSSADSTQIRMAYKRLAMQYHPDRNAGDQKAEEMFKLINEAYHVLSDPLKKSRFDSHLNPVQPLHAQEAYRRERNRRRYYQWKHAQENTYQFDKNYFKVQGLAIATFFVIAGFCYGIIHFASYIMEQKRLEKFMANSRQLKLVNGLFETGKFTDAFLMLDHLKEGNPLEFRFIFAHDSLLGVLRKKAEQEYEDKNFPEAVRYFTTLKNIENPTRAETLKMIANCQFYLGNFTEALQALKQVHSQDPRNLELIYTIAFINLEKLNNPAEALHYFTLGKTLFKKNMSEIYGDAFEIIINPADVPDLYVQIFIGRGRANIALSNYEEAVTDGNWSVFLRRQQVEGYELRAQAKAGTKDYSGLCEDIAAAKKLGSVALDSLAHLHCR